MSQSEIESLKKQLIDYQKSKDDSFNRLQRNIDTQIKEINKKIKKSNKDDNKQNLEKDLSLVQPFEKDIEAGDPRPNIFEAGIKEKNIDIKNLSNHELHKIKNIMKIDHSKKQKTIMDLPLSEILDNTINFLSKFQDSFQTKYYEAELLLNVYSTDKTALTKLKVYITALALFVRDDMNSIYIGIIMVFLSIIIYFINIITFK